MKVTYAFLDRQRERQQNQRIQEEEIQCQDPFELGFQFNYKISPRNISAVNFISLYLHHENPEPIKNAMQAGFLSSHQMYSITNSDIFDYESPNKTTNEESQFTTTLTLDHDSLVVYYNQVINRFPNQDLTVNEITNRLVSHYVDLFLSFFNQNKFQRMFPSKEESLRLERLLLLKQQKERSPLRNILEISIKEPNAKLEFKPATDIDDWRANLIIP